LRKCYSLERIFLDKNNIGDALLCEEFQKYLINNNYVKEISLNSCGLKESNILSLGDALQSNVCLQKLSLRNNYITVI
jgi:hypothetical protein